MKAYRLTVFANGEPVSYLYATSRKEQEDYFLKLLSSLGTYEKQEKEVQR